MYQQMIRQDLEKILKKLKFETLDIVCDISENPQFGDYTTNIALQLAKQDSRKSYHSSFEIAKEILENFGHPSYLERVEMAEPGFINFFLKTESLIRVLMEKSKLSSTTKNGKRYLVEFAHPNTHKAFHIGHLRNISIGESICRLLESGRNEVFRVTYGGDIGPHVAKALWGVKKLKDQYEEVKVKSLREKAEFLGKAYALGAEKYGSDPKVKEEIDALNVSLYKRDPKIIPLWEETKKWSIAYFDSIYSMVGTEFDAEIWESEVQEEGTRIVKENIGKVFKKDQGAVIFPGKEYGLHNRVFLTSAGYPTYEAKELGLTQKEEELFPFDKSLHIVANEQAGFFKVVIAALEILEEKRKDKKHHVSYGMVNLASGKMSSRKGEIITAEELIDQVKEEIAKQFQKGDEKIAIAAIKFSMLKYSLNSDISFDIEKSVSLQGDSGPYLLYTYARAQSVVRNSGSSKLRSGIGNSKLEEEEREVLRLLEYFEGVVEKTANSLEPSKLCYYLLDLAKAFNLFYQRYPIIKSKKADLRLLITKKVGETLKSGLYLLGIETLERM